MVSGAKRHVVMLDVDSKDATVGMSCPPEPFVETKFLENIRSLLHPGGMYLYPLLSNTTFDQMGAVHIDTLY